MEVFVLRHPLIVSWKAGTYTLDADANITTGTGHTYDKPFYPHCLHCQNANARKYLEWVGEWVVLRTDRVATGGSSNVSPAASCGGPGGKRAR